MSGAGVRIGVGTRVMYDGAVHEVTEWLPTVCGTDVVLRGPNSVCRMSVVELVGGTRVRLLTAPAGDFVLTPAESPILLACAGRGHHDCAAHR